MRGALITGTVLSVVVTGVWSTSTVATSSGPAPADALSFWRHPSAASFRVLADGPTGNGWQLFAVLSVIYTLCLLIGGWRRARRYRPPSSRPPCGGGPAAFAPPPAAPEPSGPHSQGTGSPVEGGTGREPVVVAEAVAVSTEPQAGQPGAGA